MTDPYQADDAKPSLPFFVIQKEVGERLQGDDVTFYLPNRSSKTRGALLPDGKLDPNHPIRLLGKIDRKQTDLHAFRFSGKVAVEVEEKPPKNEAHYLGRALACMCFTGEQVSVTVRTEQKIAPTKLPRQAFQSSFNASDKKNDKYPISIKALIDYLWTFLGATDPVGAVLVTGATASGKTQVANGLIHEFAKRRLEQTSERRPHIVTCEDPIEKRMYDSPGAAFAAGVDYTPRELKIDVPSVQSALEDALRQKPSVVYLGELRADNDIAAMTTFARTGHLVIATAHAGSLVEAMDKVLLINKAKSAAQRGQVGESLLALVHLRGHEFDSKMKWNACLPALWRRKSTGVAELISDGLSSLLPQVPMWSEEVSQLPFSSFGRRLFVNFLRRKDALHQLSEEQFSELESKSLEWDMEGL
jgi:hypothetical protein